MATPKWEPGKLYPPGSLVVPRTDGSTSQAQLPSPGFDANADGWTFSAGAGGSIAWSATGGYQSPGCIRYASTGGGSSDGRFTIADPVQVVPGQSITASAMFRLAVGPGGFGASLSFSWYDAAGNPITDSTPPESQVIRKTHGSGWRKQSFTAIAPPNARLCRIAGFFDKTTASGDVEGFVDDVSWSYVPPTPTAGLMFRATQPATGYSGTAEPVWPTTTGVTVTDNEVIWEGVMMSRVVWRAHPILVSGDAEPAWPDNIGDSVPDNTISWSAVNPATSDANCPQSKIVAIAKFKVYAGDGDVVRYTATLNPQDWSSEKDAGYLGTGLQQNGANRVALLNLYRANLVVMNATTFQQWQIDPDPSLMDLLDTMDGIGSIWHLAAQPVSNDLFYLSNRGVRTIGMSGTTNNLKAGDVGLPVDDMVRALVSELVETNRANGNENLQPIGLYLPSMGQYWLAFNREVNPGDTGPGSAIDVCPGLAENEAPVDPEIWYTDEISMRDQDAYDDPSWPGGPPGWAYMPWYRNEPGVDEQIEIGCYIIGADITFTITVESETSESHQIIVGIDASNVVVAGTQETGETKTYSVSIPGPTHGSPTNWATTVIAINVASNDVSTRHVVVTDVSAVYKLSDRGQDAPQPARKYSEVMVYTLTQVGQVGAWSRYIFPFPIDAWAQEGDDLYARDGNTVYRISEDIGCRDRWTGAETGEGAYWERFDAIIQWPWLDMGPPGIDKQMEDFDVVGYGGVEVEVGYDQTEPGYFTEPYPVVADTLRGTTIPMPLTSPSYSVRLRYRGMLGASSGDTPAPDAVYNRTWGFNAMRINFT